MHYMPPCSDLRSTHNLSTLSGAVLCSDRGRARVLVSGEETRPRPLQRSGPRRFQGGLDGLGTHVKGGAISTPLQDRKSTRLNSSHVKNSYAVFCLKKKTH